MTGKESGSLQDLRAGLHLGANDGPDDMRPGGRSQCGLVIEWWRRWDGWSRGVVVAHCS